MVRFRDAAGLAIGIALVTAFVMSGGIGPVQFSTGGGGNGGTGGSGDDVRTGTSADLSLAAFDRTEDSSTQVGASAKTWNTGQSTTYLGSTSLSASSRTKVSNFVVGDSFKAIAFDSTYNYGKVIEGDITSAKVLQNLDTYEGAGTGDLSTTVYDENGDSTSSVNLGSDEQYSFNKIDVEVAASNKAYNPHLIAFEYSGNTDSNVSSVEMPDAEEVACPDDIDSAMSASADTCFVAFDSNEGAPSMSEWDTQSTGNLVVTADGDGTSGETLEYAIDDLAPYINNNDRLGFATADDSSSPSDVGVGHKTGSVTLN